MKFKNAIKDLFFKNNDRFFLKSKSPFAPKHYQDLYPQGFKIYTFNAPDNTPVQQPSTPTPQPGRPVVGKPGIQPIQQKPGSPAKGDSKKKATATAQSF